MRHHHAQNPPRQPSGTPTGGQFAGKENPESAVVLGGLRTKEEVWAQMKIPPKQLARLMTDPGGGPAIEATVSFCIKHDDANPAAVVRSLIKKYNRMGVDDNWLNLQPRDRKALMVLSWRIEEAEAEKHRPLSSSEVNELADVVRRETPSGHKPQEGYQYLLAEEISSSALPTGSTADTVIDTAAYVPEESSAGEDAWREEWRDELSDRFRTGGAVKRRQMAASIAVAAITNVVLPDVVPMPTPAYKIAQPALISGGGAYAVAAERGVTPESPLFAPWGGQNLTDTQRRAIVYTAAKVPSDGVKRFNEAFVAAITAANAEHRSQRKSA